jgi:hypothetical protein
LTLLKTYYLRMGLLGGAGLLGTGGLAIAAWYGRRRVPGHPLTAPMLALFSAPLFWYILFAEHAFFHQYELLLAVPAVCAAAGLSFGWLAGLTESGEISAEVRRVLGAVLFVLVPAVMLAPALPPLVLRATGATQNQGLVRFGRDIEAATPPGSIVLISSFDKVICYYSRRHTIEGITDDTALDRRLGTLHAEFPGLNSAYLALRPSETAAFARTLAAYPRVASADSVVVVRLPL